MMEEFALFLLNRMRGSTNKDRPQDAGRHPHREKWEAIHAVLSCLKRMAALHFYLDLWAYFGPRHEACLTKSEYGGFAPGLRRHEMAVQAMSDLLWYRSARADPAAAFPSLTSYLERSHRRRFIDRMTEEVSE